MTIERSRIALGLSLLAAMACAPPADAPEPAALFERAEGAARAIDAGVLKDVVAELSGDRYEGRGPGTEGDRLARRYIAEQLAANGFEPAGPDGGWEQPFELVGMTASMPDRWEFAGPSGTAEELRFWDDYIAASGVQRPEVSIEDAEVVFVGYGIEAPEENWDDFKGADLAGKILLMLNNDPDWDPELFGGERRLYYGRWTYKYESAARHGAAGAIIIHTDASAGYPWQVVQTSWTGPQFELPAGDEPRIEIAAWITSDKARRLAALAGKDLDTLIAAARKRDFAPVPLGIRTSIRFETELTRTETANVLGLMRGSDPELSREVVIYTAHHDHLGTGEPDESGDRIYNGALDNASGVAQLLAIGRAFAALPAPPRRSVMLLFVAAEEQGLIGSRYFSLRPTIPPARIAADINIDGGNIWGRTRDIGVIGNGKSTLEDLLAVAAERQGRVVKPEPFPDKGYYYRSDQFSFARIGVPALYFKSGTDYIGRPAGWGEHQLDEWRRTKYHQPSDELDDTWDLTGMVDDARLAFLVGYAVAQLEEPPRWYPGDEFERIRARSLGVPQEAGG